MSPPRPNAGLEPIRQPEPILLLLRDLVHEATGVFFDDSRLDLMLDKLRERLVACQCHSYLDYYYVLKYDEKGREEWRRLMDAVSVQETYFWREADQIRALVDQIVPAWFARTQLPLHIWSAACATGEEPYSLAIALEEGGWGKHPILIHASDASETALTKARAGVYRERSFRSLPAELRERYFTTRPDGSHLRANIIARVDFQWANLADRESCAAVPISPVIFCRNVFIYFSVESITRVINALADRTPVNGYLFIGSSESLIRLTDRFELKEMGKAFVYVRTAAP